MQIKILWPWDLPTQIRGAVVVADIFAATTNITSLIARSVKQLILGNSDTVFLLKRRFPEALLIGESLVLSRQLFDVSNLPSDVEATNVTGREIIFLTSNGTRVVEESFVKGASMVLTVSFTNIASVARWIRDKKLGRITLVPAGSIGEIPIREDELCTQALRQLLTGKRVDWKGVVGEAQEYIQSYDPDRNFIQEFELIFALNRYDVVPLCRRATNGFVTVTKS